MTFLDSMPCTVRMVGYGWGPSVSHFRLAQSMISLVTASLTNVSVFAEWEGKVGMDLNAPCGDTYWNNIPRRGDT